jgi:Response regulator containing CheY-like receiver domain and AraC-type DNA-binding domain
MIRLMIVEDEPAIQNGIRELITSLNMPIEIVGCCFNGKTALEALDPLKPDIILTDIRMPVMNGLELIKNTIEIRQNSEFIILSGYSDFEYARTAMKYGVTQYLLKPSNSDEFRAVLEEACRNAEEKKKEGVRRHLAGILFCNDGTAALASVLPETYPYHYLVILCLGAFSTNSIDYIKPDASYWNADCLERHINRKMADSGECFAIDSKAANEKIVFLSVQDKSVLHIKKFINEMTSYVKASGMPLTAVISELFTAVDHLEEIHHDIRIILNNRILIGKSRVIIQDEVETEPHYIAIDNQQRLNIQHILEKEDFQALAKEFSLLADCWRRDNIPQIICEFSVKYLISEICGRFQVLQKQYSLDLTLSKVEHEICSSTSFEGFESGIIGIMNELGRAVWNNKVNLNVNEVVEQLYEYIREHYTEAFSYEEFAKRFGYHSNYISNTFTNSKGISPNKLITNLRIEKAKELLINYSYPLKEISGMIGYNDVFYFSRIFKESVGVSPKHYRENYSSYKNL